MVFGLCEGRGGTDGLHRSIEFEQLQIAIHIDWYMSCSINALPWMPVAHYR